MTLRRRKRRSEFERIRELLATVDKDGLATQVAEVYTEEIVRLRGEMQQALDALNHSPYQSAWNEAKARKILREALKYEGWLRGVLERPRGDAA